MEGVERLSLNVLRLCACVCVLLNRLSLKTKQSTTLAFPGGPHAICAHEARVESPASTERT